MKRKPRPKPISKKYIYHIILTNRGSKLKELSYADTEEKANKRFNKMLKENKENVKFPIRWIVQGHDIFESDYELVIIKVKDGDPDSKTFRDDNGHLVSYDTSDENWVIYDRAPYNMEESFWVYGFHPLLQRKDYGWIFDNFISQNTSDKTHIKTVAIFKNKLLIDTEETLNMVICKNKSDSIRLYNAIEGDVKKMKLKNVLFIGDVWESKSRQHWYDKVANLTHWKWKKIIRHTTRP